jgi:hypothetical protein
MHPALSQTVPSDNVSPKYKLISTESVVNTIVSATGFEVSRVVTQSRGNTATGRHVVVFKSPVTGDASLFPTIALLNSHNGTSAFKLVVGFHVVACSNGLFYSPDATYQNRIIHAGPNVLERVASACKDALAQLDAARLNIDFMRRVVLSADAQQRFAYTAIKALRPETVSGLNTASVLQLGRELTGQSEPTLWNVFNRIQNSLINGGYKYVAEESDGALSLQTARRIRAPHTLVKLNTDLWALALKAA